MSVRTGVVKGDLRQRSIPRREAEASQLRLVESGQLVESGVPSRPSRSGKGGRVARGDPSVGQDGVDDSEEGGVCGDEAGPHRDPHILEKS